MLLQTKSYSLTNWTVVFVKAPMMVLLGKDRICNFVLWRDGNGFVSDLEHLLGSWVFDTTNTGDFSKVSSKEHLQPS